MTHASNTNNKAPARPVPAAAPAPALVSAATPHEITVRVLRDTDSIPEITRLLHRAYAGQVAMGLQPLAGRQDDATTRRRCTSGQCYLALLREGMNAAGGPREKIVGTILFHEVEADQGPPWFQNKFVDSFSQFAVDPDLQGRGIGLMLLDKAESRAAECGATELGLSMADPDAALKKFYLKRGYRFIEFWKWPYTNYTSAILSKTVRDG